MNGILGLPWANIVFWTLALEFQFYVLLGLVFPLVVSPNLIIRVAVISAILLLSISSPVPSPATSAHFVIPFLPLFSAGILVFWLRNNMVSWPTFWALILVNLAALLYQFEPLAFISVSGAVLCTLFARLRSALFLPLSRISYPVYLVHVPFLFLLYVPQRVLGPGVGREEIGLFLAASGTLAGGYLMHKLIEAPSQRLSSQIRFSSNDRPAICGATSRKTPH
ncbi:MAG: hypothetical protein QM780_06820 [Hyphomicrobium sp.]